MFQMDASELNKLAADLGQVPRRALPVARAAVQKTSADIKATGQQLAPVDTGNLRNSITYRTRELSNAVEGEIGPTADYGHYVEFGTSRMPPHAFMGPALDRHGHELETALAKILDQF